MPGRIMTGVLLLILGAAFLMDQLNVVQGMHELMLRWWPLLLILLAVNALVRRPSRPWGASLLLLFGVLLQLEHLQLLKRDVWPAFWSVVLIILGIQLLLPRRRLGRVMQMVTRDRVRESVTFATIVCRNETTHFQGGMIDATFSKYELDLRGATLAPSGAELELNSNFSSIILRVPPEWVVASSGMPNFGSSINRTPQTGAGITGQPTLCVYCAGQFGSVEITN